MLFDGRNGGTVELLESVLVIRRRGLGSFLTQGLKGEKRIPYSSIRSVQFKEAGFTTGYIQFGVAGGVESRGGVWDATTDENTVLFTKEAAADFRRLRDAVEDLAAAARNPQPVIAQQASHPINISEELGRLADLRDRAVLTEDEFTQQKLRLLNGAANVQMATAHPHQPSPTRDLRRRAAPDTFSNPPSKNRTGQIIGVCLLLFVLIIIFH